MGNMIPHPSAHPPMLAVAAVLSRYDRQKLSSFIEVAIGLLDTFDGDLDAEAATWTEAGNRNTHADLPDGHELSGDEADTGWTEWQSRGRHKQTAGGYEPADQHEDDEEDDPSGQCDEDGVNTGLATAIGYGAGCSISDPGGCEHDGREPENAE